MSKLSYDLIDKTMINGNGLGSLNTIKNGAGDSAYDVVQNFGLEVKPAEHDILGKDEVNAMIDLHIEQGRSARGPA